MAAFSSGAMAGVVLSSDMRRSICVAKVRVFLKDQIRNIFLAGFGSVNSATIHFHNIKNWKIFSK
jgi:hypothetical protein